MSIFGVNPVIKSTTSGFGVSPTFFPLTSDGLYFPFTDDELKQWIGEYFANRPINSNKPLSKEEIEARRPEYLKLAFANGVNIWRSEVNDIAVALQAAAKKKGKEVDKHLFLPTATRWNRSDGYMGINDYIWSIKFNYTVTHVEELGGHIIQF
jgi:hypothetical protein